MNRKELTLILSILAVCASVVGLVFIMSANYMAYGVSWNVAAIFWAGAYIAKK